MKVILDNAGKRIAYLIRVLDVEGAELLSVGLCLSWYIPLLLSTEILKQSIFFVAITRLLPTTVLFSLVSFLMAYQTIGVVLGGIPSGVLRSQNDALFWLKWRRNGMYGAGFLWAFIGVLMAQIAITPGSVFYGGVGVFAMGWGIWRLRFLLIVEKELHALRAIEKSASDGSMKHYLNAI